MSKRVAGLVVRTVYRREEIVLLSSRQQRCFSCSSTCKVGGAAGKGIPSAKDWDGVAIARTPPILGRPKARSRPAPGAPIRDASEFTPNTLARDLAAQRLQQYSQDEYTEREKSKNAEVGGGEGKAEWKNGSGSRDMGLIRRKQGQKAQQKDEGVGAAMQNFQEYERGSDQQQARTSKGDARNGQKQQYNATTARNTQNTRTSRRRDAKLTDEDVAKTSFSGSHPSPQTEYADTTSVFDGDNFATETPLKLKRPDAVTVTKDEAFPDPLAILNSQVFFDADVDGQMNELVGDYNPHFSAQNWELAHKEKTGKALAPLEYASFAIAHNVTLNAAKKRRSLNTIKRFLQRAT